MPELVVTLKGREIQRLPITRTQTKIGRDPTNDLVIDNVGVSRQHAVILAYDEHLVVLDTGSANGLFVNNRQSDEHRLQDGDEIQIGKFVVHFQESGGVPLGQLEKVRYTPPPARPGGFNEATYALSSEEVQRVMERARQQAAARRAPTGNELRIRESVRAQTGGSRAAEWALWIVAAAAVAGLVVFLLMGR